MNLDDVYNVNKLGSERILDNLNGIKLQININIIEISSNL